MFQFIISSVYGKASLRVRIWTIPRKYTLNQYCNYWSSPHLHTWNILSIWILSKRDSLPLSFLPHWLTFLHHILFFLSLASRAQELIPSSPCVSRYTLGIPWQQMFSTFLQFQLNTRNTFAIPPSNYQLALSYTGTQISPTSRRLLMSFLFYSVPVMLLSVPNTSFCPNTTPSIYLDCCTKSYFLYPTQKSFFTLPVSSSHFCLTPWQPSLPRINTDLPDLSFFCFLLMARRLKSVLLYMVSTYSTTELHPGSSCQDPVVWVSWWAVCFSVNSSPHMLLGVFYVPPNQNKIQKDYVTILHICFEYNEIWPLFFYHDLESLWPDNHHFSVILIIVSILYRSQCFSFYCYHNHYYYYS